MNPLFPVRLLLRALEDLHAIAQAARDRDGQIARIEAAADLLAREVRAVHADLIRTEDALETVADTAEPLQGAAERVGRIVKPKR